MSGKQEREKRREERLQAETKVDSADRRTRILQLGAGAVFLAVVAVIVVIIVAASGGDDGGDTQLEGVAEINQELEGIPQEGMALGDPNAPVELVEFGDLQCPFCKLASEEVLPPVIEGPVAQGQSRLVFRNFTIIGPESIPAAQAAIAAGMQGVGWNFVEIFYRNQGKERSGYINDAFLKAVAEAAGVGDIAKWNEDRNSQAVKAEVKGEAAEASRLGFTGTPSYAVKGPGTSSLEPLGSVSSSGELESAINAAS